MAAKTRKRVRIRIPKHEPKPDLEAKTSPENPARENRSSPYSPYNLFSSAMSKLRNWKENLYGTDPVTQISRSDEGKGKVVANPKYVKGLLAVQLVTTALILSTAGLYIYKQATKGPTIVYLPAPVQKPKDLSAMMEKTMPSLSDFLDRCKKRSTKLIPESKTDVKWRKDGNVVVVKFPEKFYHWNHGLNITLAANVKGAELLLFFGKHSHPQVSKIGLKPGFNLPILVDDAVWIGLFPTPFSVLALEELFPIPKTSGQKDVDRYFEIALDHMFAARFSWVGANDKAIKWIELTSKGLNSRPSYTAELIDIKCHRYQRRLEMLDHNF